MGRPKLTEIRTAEILDAFERCVARYGLEGSSLERVAEEAGMKRSILRHYIGNRDEMIVALANRVVSKYRGVFQEFLGQISDRNRTEQLLSYFFPHKPVESTEDILVVEALIAAAEQYPDVRQLMFGYVDGLVGDLSQQLRLAFPNASKLECWNVAYGVVSICFNQESLSPMQLPPKYVRAARTCSEALVQSLGT
jgi:AcrR family transcriptional regulator